MAEDVVTPSILGQTFTRLASEHAVYKATIKGQDFVLKADGKPTLSAATNKQYFEAAADLFRAITPGFCEMRMLKSDETAALHAWVKREEARRAKPPKMPPLPPTPGAPQMPPLPPVPNAAPARPTSILPNEIALPENDDSAVDDVKDPAKVWFIMKFVKGLVSADKFQGSHKSTIAGKPDLMIELGKIITVDIFLGSTDRFIFARRPSFTGGLKGDWGHKQVSWAIQNAKNIFLVEGSPLKFIGLDFLDPNSGYNDLSKPVPTDNDVTPWPGQPLKGGNSDDRDAMADEICDSLNKVLGLGLGKAHKEKLRKGLADGKEALKKHLDKNKPSLAGLKDRVKRLGW
jgi:hypothetical protein